MRARILCESGKWSVDSVLSPALYNLYTSDMPAIDDCQLALFADDTALKITSKLYETVKKRQEKVEKSDRSLEREIASP